MEDDCAAEIKYGDTVVHVIIILDEASKYAVAAEIFRRNVEESRNTTAEEMVKALETHWTMHYIRKLKQDVRTVLNGQEAVDPFGALASVVAAHNTMERLTMSMGVWEAVHFVLEIV